MEWYQNNPNGFRRLRLEEEQMWRNSAFDLYKDDETGTLSWKGLLSSHGHTHRVKLVYSRSHPTEKMTVYVTDPQLPQTNHHIYADGRICYEMNDWTPEWTALQVAALTQHFLNEFYSGRMNNSFGALPDVNELLRMYKRIGIIKNDFE